MIILILFTTSPIVPMPEHIKLHNACNEPCDALVGTCVCGAWHKAEDWEGKIENAKQYVIDSYKIK